MSEKYNFIENKNKNKTFSYIIYDRIENFLHKMNSSSLFQMYFVTSGEGYYIHHNVKYQLVKNDLLIVNPLEEIGFSTKENTTLTFIGFGVEQIKCHMPKNDQTMIIKGSDPFFSSIINHIYNLAKNEDETLPLSNLYFQAFFKELSNILSTQDFKRPLTKEEILVAKVKDYLDSHLLEKITIQSLADNFYCSPSALLHYFKKIEGVPIIEYVQSKRLELAKFFLRTGERKIADICVDVGFSSTQFFYSYFIKKEGVTPNEYRRLHKTDL